MLECEGFSKEDRVALASLKGLGNKGLVHVAGIAAMVQREAIVRLAGTPAGTAEAFATLTRELAGDFTNDGGFLDQYAAHNSLRPRQVRRIKEAVMASFAAETYIKEEGEAWK